MFWCLAVIDGDYDKAGEGSQLAANAIAGVHVSDYPAATMKINQGAERSVALRAIYPDGNGTRGAADLRVFDGTN